MQNPKMKRKITIRLLGSEKHNIGFVEIDFYRSDGTICMQYSETSSGLQNKKSFGFKENEVRLTKCENVCALSSH
jgi:hypothetical protein